MYPFDVVISRNIISANSIGIHIHAVRTYVTHNSISYNEYGVIYVGSTGNVASYNDIYRNSLYGMDVKEGATVNAEHNYWGDPSGPYHPTVNPDGKGDTVGGNGEDLDFIPWLTEPVGHINERPFAVLEVDKTTVLVGEEVTFDARASTDDGEIVKYLFIFGDGTNSSWTTLPVVKHNYTAPGTYNASLVVMDNFGVTSNNTATVTITVRTKPPETPPPEAPPPTPSPIRILTHINEELIRILRGIPFVGDIIMFLEELVPGYGALAFTTTCLLIIIALVVLRRRRGVRS